MEVQSAQGRQRPAVSITQYRSSHGGFRPFRPWAASSPYSHHSVIHDADESTRY
jgi:hypothetical protein